MQARHHGSLKSSRQQKVLKALKKGGWCSGLTIVLRAGEYINNVAEAISALRFNGIEIESRPVAGKRHFEWRIK